MFTKFGECLLARPLTVWNFVALRHEVCQISTVENLRSRKSGPKFTKIWDALLCTNAPHRVKFHRARPNDVWEKCYKFLHPSVFWRPKGLLGQVRLPLSTCQTLSRSDNLGFFSSISLTAWPTKNSKRRVSAYHAATIIIRILTSSAESICIKLGFDVHLCIAWCY